MSMPNVDANIRVPVSDSCNCCEQIACNWFCCGKKDKTPKHTCEDQKVHAFVSSFPLKRNPSLIPKNVDDLKVMEKK